jgi:hypothetical protein
VASVAITLGAFIFIFRASMSGGRPGIPNEAYYSIDDGATFFADSNTLVPPFEYDGKQAVKAQVYSCGQTKFVGYLIRYTPAAKSQLEAANGVGVGAIRAAGTEIKAALTGDQGWINSNARGANGIYAVRCPDGSSNVPDLALP